MLASYVHFFGSAIFFFLFLLFLHIYRSKHNLYIFFYSITFLFLFLFTFASSVPIIIYGGNNISAWANVGANIFVFCLIATCLRVQLAVQDPFLIKNIKKLDIILLLVALVSTTIQIMHLQNPEVSPKGVVWHLNPISGWIITITAFCYGIYWSYFFGKIARLLKDTRLKINMWILSVNGVVQGSSALFFFVMESPQKQLFGLILLCGSGLISLILFLIPEIIFHIKLSRDNRKMVGVST